MAFEFFFQHPVREQQESCLEEAIAITIDELLEGPEVFYVVVDASLSTPPGVRYGEEFFVIIKDDGTNLLSVIVISYVTVSIYSK